MPPRIAVLVTCHNRRDKTVECLRALRNQQGRVESQEPRTKNQQRGTTNQEPTTRNHEPRTKNGEPAPPAPLYPPPFTLSLFLTDDGCTDGTADAVREVWPEAMILQGDGNLYWCGGMRKAWAEAAKTDPDFYLLLNDDTIIKPQALLSLLQVLNFSKSLSVAVAAIADCRTGEIIYGGISADPSTPFHPEAELPVECASLNANCVLIPREVYKKAGMFSAHFTHAMGDMDYAKTLLKQDVKIHRSGKILGFCSQNPVAGTWRDTNLPALQRLKLATSIKFLPPKEWLAFNLRHSGWKWPVYFVSPYIKIFLGK